MINDLRLPYSDCMRVSIVNGSMCIWLAFVSIILTLYTVYTCAVHFFQPAHGELGILKAKGSQNFIFHFYGHFWVSVTSSMKYFRCLILVSVIFLCRNHKQNKLQIDMLACACACMHTLLTVVILLKFANETSKSLN